MGSSIAGMGDKVKELKDVLGGKKDPDAGEQPAETAADMGQGSEAWAAEKAVFEEKIKKLEADTQEARDKYLLTLAEFDNFRKRMERDRDDMVKYGNEKLLKELVPVLDHLDMTLSHAAPAEKPDPVLEGVMLVAKQFVQTLEKCGVEFVSEAKVSFDPNVHESIGVAETAEVPDGQVVTVHRKGFKLNGRLIRPALVTVARAPS